MTMNTHVKAIIRELEKCLSSGLRPSQIYEDWLLMVHASLEILPEHAKSAKQTGQLAEDNQETKKLWERLRERYDNPVYWEHLAKAFAILMNSTDEYYDVVGDIYMNFGNPNKRSGQFFTPFHVAKLMAEIHAKSTEALVHERIKDAIKGNILAESMLLAGMTLEGDEAYEWLVTRILPAIAKDIEVVTVSDPACGSGVMFLALASCLPRWMTEFGLVQFYGMDIDQMCVLMCKVNVMLYGLNGYAVKCINSMVESEKVSV